MEEAMKLLWVSVFQDGGDRFRHIYEGPLDKAPGPVQAAFALDADYDPPKKVAAMWVVRHAIQLPPHYLVVADAREGVDIQDLLQAMNMKRKKDFLGDIAAQLLKEWGDVDDA